jgi:signal transduction histidine kinase
VGDASATLEADPRKLRQAVLNLVLNAMQSSPRGERVTLEVGRTCARSHFTKIKVIDRGAGMSPEVLERIKKPYFTTREGGTGLGVAVARGIIEQHGGTLDYESAPGKGTTVTIRLPQRPLPEEERALLPKVHCGVAMARAAAIPAEPAPAPVVTHDVPLTAKA